MSATTSLRWYSWLFRGVYAGSLTCSVFLAALTEMKKYPKSWLHKLVLGESSTTWIDDAWWLLLVLPFVIVGSKELFSRFLPLLNLKVIKALLDTTRDQMFSDRANQEKHHHRITIFKYSYWQFSSLRLPKTGGWLKLWLRSGHATQNAKVLFRAPGDPEKAEGIAGRAWATEIVVSVHDLMSISLESSTEDLQIYARNTNVSLEWLLEKLSEGACKQRAMIGSPIMANGKMWGAIVLDSREPDEIAYEQAAAVINTIQVPLETILSRGRNVALD